MHIDGVTPPGDEFNYAEYLFALNRGRGHKVAYIDDRDRLEYADLEQRARQLAQALVDSGVDGKVITIELEPDNLERARENVTKAGLSDRVEFHLGNSHDLLGNAIAAYPEIRFAYLDASHLFDC